MLSPASRPLTLAFGPTLCLPIPVSLAICRLAASLFPGRLGSSRARRLLLSVSGDVDIALAVLMDEDAES